MKRDVPTFASEAALCAAFSAEMTRQGWTPYPETSGWDLLLVGHGLQVGVEAKLKPSMGVLAQIAKRISSEWRNAGPNYAVILVPHVTKDFSAVARALGADVLYPSTRHALNRGAKALVWPELTSSLAYAQALHFGEPAWVPEVVPDVAAGVPCPVRLTPWKLSALRLVARLEVRGYVTVADFRELGLHSSRWYHHWLLPEGSDRPQRWVRKPGVALADAQHPDVFQGMVEYERERGVVREEPAARPLFAEALP